MTAHETTHPPVKDIGCQGTILVTSRFSSKLSILTLTRPIALPLGSEGLPSAPDCHEAPDSALRPSPSLQSAGGLCLGHRTKALPSVHLPSGPGAAGWADQGEEPSAQEKFIDRRHGKCSTRVERVRAESLALVVERWLMRLHCDHLRAGEKGKGAKTSPGVPLRLEAESEGGTCQELLVRKCQF